MHIATDQCIQYIPSKDVWKLSSTTWYELVQRQYDICYVCNRWAHLSRKWLEAISRNQVSGSNPCLVCKGIKLGGNFTHCRCNHSVGHRNHKHAQAVTSYHQWKTRWFYKSFYYHCSSWWMFFVMRFWRNSGYASVGFCILVHLMVRLQASCSIDLKLVGLKELKITTALSLVAPSIYMWCSGLVTTSWLLWY